MLFLARREGFGHWLRPPVAGLSLQECGGRGESRKSGFDTRQSGIDLLPKTPRLQEPRQQGSFIPSWHGPPGPPHDTRLNCALYSAHGPSVTSSLPHFWARMREEHEVTELISGLGTARVMQRMAMIMAADE
ncbi:hypothetical protein HYALB_00006899 [Hymenoscyphus albidus]|uniref:Uncharacterized protein n=1 Tax=Hymenoscyphus albidus TaxID=595503 RepID=A0A9N9M4A9_9HELO|nr:hypothetical protein HYALB_00006899 [Hymenoscyphus albidus]